MAKDPAFLFYSQDFFTGVSTMSFEDRGKFITILCLMHQQGRMDEESISFIVGSISVKLKSKFDIDKNGLWFNKKLEEETEKRNKFTESRRSNGLLGGRPDKKDKPIGKPKDNLKVMHKANLMEDVNEDEIVIKNKSEIIWPTENEFLAHCQEVLQNEFNKYEFSLISKYNTWKDSGWKDGHGKKITNWKNKINNTIPYLKPTNNGNKKAGGLDNLEAEADRILRED